MLRTAPCPASTASGVGGGTITGVTDGSGLTGGGTSGNVTLAAFISQSFRSTLQPALDPLYVFGVKSRTAAGPTGLPETLPPLLAQLGRPLTHRLPMGPNLAGHFQLTQSLLEQVGGLHAGKLGYDFVGGGD
jgi:hypothetical protein